MSTTVEPCLTCFRKTDNYLRITDDSNDEDVERIVTTHFWFSVSAIVRGGFRGRCY